MRKRCIALQLPSSTRIFKKEHRKAVWKSYRGRRAQFSCECSVALSSFALALQLQPRVTLSLVPAARPHPTQQPAAAEDVSGCDHALRVPYLSRMPRTGGLRLQARSLSIQTRNGNTGAALVF